MALRLRTYSVQWTDLGGTAHTSAHWYNYATAYGLAAHLVNLGCVSVCIVQGNGTDHSPRLIGRPLVDRHVWLFKVELAA
jgi:hypothetical protein